MPAIQTFFKIILLSTLALGACGQQTIKKHTMPLEQSKPKNAGYLLLFSEKRPLEPEGSVRIIITDQFLRIDEGPGSEDFMLFNRQTKTIANIVKEDKSILVFSPGEQNTQAPFDVQWTIESQPSQAIMRTGPEENSRAVHRLFYLNDKPCYNLVTLENHLVDTLPALQAYHHALANELKRNYRPLDGEQCRDALQVFDPNIRLRYGFPIREWSNYGYQRFLVNFRTDVIFPDSMFILPKTYKTLVL